eukprot:TRINITY_DN15590_c0_g1_i1.p1 TRINITY_DN15590_c0_g1~~TRINITY_DN15590_c0_g1_i1.p1  ORF type:complete len:526 (-),score=127.27 TRINITY_DN15590_c0_g1_i1:97-1674(-)
MGACWTWRAYLLGAVGWWASVALLMALLVGDLNDPDFVAFPTMTPEARMLNWLQILNFIISLPVICQWALGFLYPGGIAWGAPSSSSAPSWKVAKGERSLEESLLKSCSATQAQAPQEADGGLVLRPPEDVLFSFRVCTRGDNPHLVQEACAQNQALLKERGLPAIVEVVSDRDLGFPDSSKLQRPAPRTWNGVVEVVQIIVPDSYQTSTGALFKARALNYAATIPGVSCVADDDQIVHLDEETRLHPSSIEGIVRFALETPDRVGQGVIVYGKRDIVQTLYTCADSIRVTDDWCKFRMNFAMGTAMAGMHGSFVVNRASLERHVTYDFGTEGSFTEDAFFAFAALHRGYKFAFIDGYMEELSPFSFVDFVKQRRRWLRGLDLLARSEAFDWRTRVPLRVFTTAWWLMPCMLPTYLLGLYCMCFVRHLHFPLPSLVIQAVSGGTLLWAYVFGACINFTPRRGWCRYGLHILLTAVGSVFFGLLECACVLYAIATPEKEPSFYIVQKEYDDLVKRVEAENERVCGA